MHATPTNNLRAAPTTTVAELQDVLADRARGHRHITSQQGSALHAFIRCANCTGQLRYDAELGMIEVQGHHG